jgi:cytochrome c oxidase subunit 1
VHGSNRLVLAHFWVAFAAFGVAILLGAWQMLVRSPLHRWVDPEQYYRAVTAHGTALAYVFPTLIAMGFGYAVCAVSLGRPMHGTRLAWTGLWLVIAGAVIALATIAAGQATVLYTFYPPLSGSPWYYLGVLIAVAGSWIWIGLMVSHFARWKRDHPGLPVPLAMFATTAGALLWAWTSLGVGAEIVFLILPNAFGWTPTIDAGLARLLFSWTLHAIVYFWLMPAYIAFYSLLPQAAGGRLYSDKMGRIAFLLLLIFSMPIGLHHLFADPQIGAGFKFLHAVFTGMVAVPTLLTIFTICASLEIAGRLRGGRGLLGWIAALPWDRPLVLASGFSMAMLGLGGASGLINMSYALNSTIHNTQWVTGHFHLIYGGAIVIMYFAIAYELWPRLTGRPLAAPKLVRLQLWTWFIGMLIVTLPGTSLASWGSPRRMAYLEFTDPRVSPPQAILVSVRRSAASCCLSAVQMIAVLLASHARRGPVSPLTFLAPSSSAQLPASLNGFGVWMLLVVALTVANYWLPWRSPVLKDTGPATGASNEDDETTRDRGSPGSEHARPVPVAEAVGFVWLPSAHREGERAISGPRSAGRSGCRSAPPGLPRAAKASRARPWRGRPRRGRCSRGATLVEAPRSPPPATTATARTASAPTRPSRISPAIVSPRSTSSSRISRAASATPPSWACSWRRCRRSRCSTSRRTLRRCRVLSEPPPRPLVPTPAREAWSKSDSPCATSRRAPHATGRRVSPSARPICADSSAPISKNSCRAFKAGNRHNDISEQMRSVARQADRRGDRDARRLLLDVREMRTHVLY